MCARDPAAAADDADDDAETGGTCRIKWANQTDYASKPFAFFRIKNFSLGRGSGS
jgi:hypothetical protein